MPQTHRPDPEKLLHLVESEERAAKKGKLKIFFGACAGVGKTYAMLHAAQDLKEEGVDVVVGIVETHGRPETQELLEGLLQLPTKSVSHRGIVLQEFNLNEALKRKPTILLLDELAHTNPIGSRNAKRWQDVKELLDAGINVYTTLNVQHLESLNDVIARITEVSVKETIPDLIFDEADEITLVDIPSDELIERLKEGKVYLAPELKETARVNFFKKTNLIALREMALRRTAERVDAQMILYSLGQPITGAEILSPRLMVCVGPELLSLRLVRATKRMADRVNAPWYATYVYNEKHHLLDKEAQDRVERALRLAEQMGGKIEYLHGQNAVQEIMNFAKKHGITRIIVGRTPRAKWREFLTGTLADGLIRHSDGIEITIIAASKEEIQKTLPQQKVQSFEIKSYLYSFLIIIAITGLGLLVVPYVHLINILMIYLMGIILIASLFQKGPLFVSSLLSFVFFNFLFIEPYVEIKPWHYHYLLSFAIILLTGFFVNSLSSRLKIQVLSSQRREKNISQLYAMTRELSMTKGHKAITEVAARHLSIVFDATITFWLPDEQDHLMLFYPEDGKIPIKEEMVAKWCFDNAQMAGKDTMTMPSAQGLYMPIISAGKTIAVLGLVPKQKSNGFTTHKISLLEGFIGLISAAFDRANTALIAEHSIIETESEKLRNILLSNFSQNLLIPLASITKFSHDLLKKKNLDEQNQTQLLEKINHEASTLLKMVDQFLLSQKN